MQEVCKMELTHHWLYFSVKCSIPMKPNSPWECQIPHSEPFHIYSDIVASNVTQDFQIAWHAWHAGSELSLLHPFSVSLHLESSLLAPGDGAFSGARCSCLSPIRQESPCMTNRCLMTFQNIIKHPFCGKFHGHGFPDLGWDRPTYHQEVKPKAGLGWELGEKSELWLKQNIMDLHG